MSIRLPQEQVEAEIDPISTSSSGTPSILYQDDHHAPIPNNKEEYGHHVNNVPENEYDGMDPPKRNKRGLALLMIVVALALSMFLVSELSVQSSL